jgi:hypothetical protein
MPINVSFRIANLLIAKYGELSRYIQIDVITEYVMNTGKLAETRGRKATGLKTRCP